MTADTDVTGVYDTFTYSMVFTVNAQEANDFWWQWNIDQPVQVEYKTGTVLTAPYNLGTFTSYTSLSDADFSCDNAYDVAEALKMLITIFAITLNFL